MGSGGGGFLGNMLSPIVGGLFGNEYDEPTMPDYDPIPTPEDAKEPETKAVRDEERRKLRSRRYLSGTVLSQPLGNITGTNSILGG